MKIWCLFRSHRKNQRRYGYRTTCDCPKFSAEYIINKNYVDDLKDRNWIDKVAGK